MNNIYIFLFCLMLIPLFSHADDELSVICGPFTTNIETPSDNSIEPQDFPFSKGMLWQVETPEGKMNYLFGTIHSQDYKVSKFPPQVRLALVKSKTLLMETIPDNEANQIFIDMMYFKNEQTITSLLEPALYQQLQNIIVDYGVESDQVKKIKPWAAFSLIGRPKPVRAATLESNLLGVAHQHLLQVKSLETMDEILSALDGLDLEDQIIILKDTICNHEQIIKDTRKLVDLYFNRDLAGIAAFSQQPHYDEGVFDRFMQRVLYERNEKMFKRITEAYIDGRVFVAVGASHLADEEGLLNRLHQAGYKVSVLY